MKILIVDDAADIRAYISMTLEQWGFEVEVACNGLTALQLIHQKAIQLVISDWMMPEMDGLELCRKLRSSDFGHYVYLIVLTAKTKSDDMVTGLSAGADDFISKPIDTEILKARIKSAIRVIEMENKLAEKNRFLRNQNKDIKTAYDQLDANVSEMQKILGETEVITLETDSKV